MRYTLTENGVQAIRIRGTDWFSWATAGASHTVLVTAETGVAEVLVTAQVTDEIEAQRLKDEELPPNFQLHIYTSVLGLRVSSVRLLSLTLQMEEKFSVIYRPVLKVQTLPASLQNRKQILIPSKLERYRQIGQKASQAMTEVLTAAEPTWIEYRRCRCRSIMGKGTASSSDTGSWAEMFATIPSCHTHRGTNWKTSNAGILP
jgi:hypothetical protein